MQLGGGCLAGFNQLQSVWLPCRTRPQVSQLTGLIELINGDLSKLDRKKLITLCTIDVHARDVVQRRIEERVESGTAFQWQSQLRYVVSEKTKATQVQGVGLHILLRSPF